MLRKDDRQRAIGVLVDHHQDRKEIDSVTAGVVWGLLPYTVPMVSGSSEKEALAKLKEELGRNHRAHDRPVVPFYDLETAMEVRSRNMLATMLLSGSLGPKTRQNLADALGLDRAEEATAEGTPEMLGAFDRLTTALARVESCQDLTDQREE